MIALSSNMSYPEDPQSNSAMLGAECDNSELAEAYAILKKYLQSNHEECAAKSPDWFPENPDYEKLTKLTIGHVFELTCDIRDEVLRRERGDPNPLPKIEEYSDKRNNARRKIGGFLVQKLFDICKNITCELERRNLMKPTVATAEVVITDKPAAPVKSVIENVILKEPIHAKLDIENVTSKETSPVKSVTEKFASYEPSPAKSVVSTQTTPSLKRPRTSEQPSPLRLPALLSGLCQLDSFSNIIEEFDSFIEDEECDDSEEIQALKLKHAQEIFELKQTISKYETIMIPEKNKEISRLISKAEEAEYKVLYLSKQVVFLKEQLKARDVVIEEQCASYETLVATIKQIQQNLTKEFCSKTNSVRELKETTVFAEFKRLNFDVCNCIQAASDAIKVRNVKTCLKQLKDLATAAKATIIGLDQILEVFKELDITDLADEGTKLKSALIQSSSELLVLARDYRSNSSNAGPIQAALQVFDHDHQLIQAFQDRLKTCVQEL